MKLDLRETKVSLTDSKWIKYFRKQKWQIANFAIDIVIVLVFVMIMGIVTLDNSDLQSEHREIDFAQRLYVPPSFTSREIRGGISLNTHSDEIYLSDDHAAFQYSATVYPAYLQDEVKITWSTTNDAVAPVSEGGLVEASVPGEAEIIARFEYNGQIYEDRALLRVLQPVTSLYMPVTTINLYNGSAGQILTAAVSPANASNQKIFWSSKDEKIAKVNENGYVIPVSTGMTEIYAVSEEGGFSAKCFVNVINYAVKVESVNILNEQKADMHLKAGESIAVSAAVIPTNAKDKTLRWTSTNPAVATVSQTGFIRAIGEGEAFINVASNNGVQDMIKLTVAPGTKKDNLNLYTPPETIYYTDAVDGSVKYSYYSESVEELVNLQMTLDPPPKINGGVQHATYDEVRDHMDPSCYYTGAYKYQFLDLSHPNGVSASALNEYLEGKGVLEGQAEAFIEAANRHGLSELYLVAHAILETGNGTSALARGIEVNGTTVYNMFGIGAFDNSAEYSGSRRAYDLGWTSVSEAIIGGAGWISQNYINAGQNTLYKILWNPQNPGTHQYATACDWATSQALNLDKLFRLFPDCVRTYDVPIFAGMDTIILDTTN